MAENQATQIELHERLVARYVLRYGTRASRVFYRDWHRGLWDELPSPNKAPRVLDLACGTGELLREAPERPMSLVGLDLSPDMLRVARNRNGRPHWVRGDAERLAFADGAFDAVFLKGCLHHLRDHRGLIHEVSRVLRPGGLAVFSEPQDDAPWVFGARRLLYRISRGFDAGDRGFRTRELERLVASGDLELTASRPYGILAYAAAGFPDHLPLLRWIPLAGVITRLFIWMDRVLLSLPPLSPSAFQRIVVARKTMETSA